MQNFGAILWDRGISGRQPWISAAVCRDTSMISFSAAGTDYYDDMDNLDGENIRQATIGIRYTFRALTVKAAYTHFTAFDMYREQKGFLSIGTTALRFASASVEIAGYRAGLMQSDTERENIACAGATIWVPWSFASASLAVSNILVKEAHRPGFVPPFTIRASIHTAPHRFGAQGVAVDIEPGDYMQIRFRAGAEYKFADIFAPGIALSTNPLMIGFGATVSIRWLSACTSFVHHPVLGWSKGADVEYVYKK